MVIEDLVVLREPLLKIFEYQALLTGELSFQGMRDAAERREID